MYALNTKNTTMHTPIHAMVQPAAVDPAHPAAASSPCTQAPAGLAAPSKTRLSTTGGVHQSRKGRRRPSRPRCRSLCVPTTGNQKKATADGRLVLRMPISVSPAPAHRSCSGISEGFSASMSVKKKSPHSIQNITWSKAPRV